MGNLRSYPWLKGFMAGALFSAIAVPTAVTLAQSYPPSFSDLLEVQGDIRGCRMVIRETSAEVFDNTELNNKPYSRIGTLSGGRYVELTGIFRKYDGKTAVQIYAYGQDEYDFFQIFGSYPQPVGWVDASKLTQCE